MQYRLALPLLFASLLLIACGHGAGDSGDGKLKVVATTTQIGDFARNVGGDRISLTVLVKPNQDAHDFEPSPSQLRDISEAAVVLRNGVGLDTYVLKAVESNSKGRVVVVTEGIDLREASGAESDAAGGGDEDHEAAAEEADGHDPHVWFDVDNAAGMVARIRDTFAEHDAANADFYRSNTDTYLRSLEDMEDSIRSQVGTLPAGCRKLVTDHDTIGYFADAYGFTVVGSVIPSASSEARPSAADVASIVGRIRSERVPAIFAETAISPDLIKQVGREAGVKVVDDLYGDSLGPSGSDGATYIEMMTANTRKIVDALKGCTV